MTQYYSRVDREFNRDSKIVTIPFPYIKREDIEVLIDDNVITEWSWLNDSQITINTELISGNILSICRTTEIDEKIVDYKNMGMVLNEDNLNASQNQLLYSIQELYDNNEVFKQDTDEILKDNKQEVIELQEAFEEEVNTKIEMVSSAAEKINQLEEAVDTAVTAADTASQKAEDIEQFVAEAEQSFNTNIQEAISESQALLQEAGEALNETKQKVEEVGGMLSLEIGDIGIAPLGIDETKGKRRYLNGQIVIQEQYVQFTNKLKSAIALYPSLACTEEEWQATATMSVGGQVGKFVVDDEAGTIRLPKIIMPIQGLTDLSKLAEIVEAGLPNITGTLSANRLTSQTEMTTSGAFTDLGLSTLNAVSAEVSNNSRIVGFDASLSNPIYGNSDTVQQEQIQYPYFIQVATGAETEDNIINEIELNNPYTLFDSKYSPNALYNASLLKSEGQYNSGAVYVTCYEGLLVEYNTDIEVGATTTLPSGTEYTKKGLSVKLSTEEYTDYDFVLNTAEETFRLPLLDGSEDLISRRYENLTLLASGSTYTAPANGWVTLQRMSTANGQYAEITNSGNLSVVYSTGPGQYISVYMPVKKGSIYRVIYTLAGADINFRFTYAQGNGSLYYYVGETVQNANLINAGRIEEKIASLIPDNSSLISSYGMPDYSAGIAQTMNTQHTASCTGYVVFQAHYANNVMKLYVNDTVIEADAGEFNQLKTLSAYVSAGDTYKTEGGGITTQSGYTPSGLMFYPLKGVR